MNRSFSEDSSLFFRSFYEEKYKNIYLLSVCTDIFKFLGILFKLILFIKLFINKLIIFMLYVIYYKKYIFTINISLKF